MMFGRIIRFCEEFFRENKKTIGILFILIAVVGGISGWRYYRYTQDVPEFCGTCHMLDESFRGWQKSTHRDITCQVCHRMSILEQNRLLIAYLLRGQTVPSKQVHGKVKPWQKCMDCHKRAVKQGTVSVRAGYGHAMHVFREGIECVKCHSFSVHDFNPDQRACSACHKGKLVHGIGMEGLLCLNCHSFSEKSPKLISSRKCLGCHKISVSGPMSMFQCLQCHKPHEKVKLQSKDCLGQCHGNEAKVGQHGIHMEIRKIRDGCLYCHKAHSWSVGVRQAKTLCSRCHPYKDPRTFIY